MTTNEIIESQFSTNIRLKDIVGRGLINNDNIALIELIKNSKDANSKKVEIIFENADTEGTTSQIIIRDFGCGMSLEDIETKWLNIAYSDKKGKTKNDGRAYAGNKGIGRFSCDRLGKKLDFYTIQKDGEGYKFSINWEEFEVDDIKKDISDKKIEIHRQNKDNFKKVFGENDFESGTVLVISNLRSSWDLSKLKILKKELEKFIINPSSEMGVDVFDVYLETNYLSPAQQKIIDGLIENKIFDKLNFRSTSILSCISEDGKIIETTITHDGNDLFTIREHNVYTKLKKNIKTKIFYLNPQAKTFFKKQTGYSGVDFGSVFLFLNSFRIFPYGEPDNDWLKLDKRKAQGYKRYLGTRELVGYVTIDDPEEYFIPVTAREGLIENESFTQLTELGNINSIGEYGFISKAIRRLEKFVVDGLDWDRVIKAQTTDTFLKNAKEEDLTYKITNKKILESLSNVIYYGTKKNTIIDVKVNYEFLLELAEKEKSTYEKFYNAVKSKIENVYNLPDIIKDKKDFINILDKTSKIIEEKEKTIEEKEKTIEEKEKTIEEKEKTIEEKEKDSAQKAQVIIAQTIEVEENRKRLEIVDKELKEKEKTIEQINSENFFLRTVSDQDIDKLIRSMHSILNQTEIITNEIDIFVSKYSLNRELIEFISYIKGPNKKIYTISKYATLKNFQEKENKIKGDLITFIKHYIKESNEINSNKNIKIIDNLSEKEIINLRFYPLEIILMIDDLISNSKKAKATELVISSYRDEKSIIIKFQDNGKGLNDSIVDLNKLFEKGVTYTNGSGIGLYSVKECINKLNGKIRIVNIKNGFCMEVAF